MAISRGLSFVNRIDSKIFSRERERERDRSRGSNRYSTVKQGLFEKQFSGLFFSLSPFAGSRIYFLSPIRRTRLSISDNNLQFRQIREGTGAPVQTTARHAVTQNGRGLSWMRGSARLNVYSPRSISRWSVINDGSLGRNVINRHDYIYSRL